MATHKCFRLSFTLITTFLLLTGSLVAQVSSGEGQDTWLQAVHEAWAMEDEAYKTSPTSPLAGVSRYEIKDTVPVYFESRSAGIERSLDKTDRSLFSLVNEGEQWTWTRFDEEVWVSREDSKVPSSAVLKAGDQLKAGRFTVTFYPSANAVTVLVFDPDTQRIRDFETLDRYEANPGFALMATIERFEPPEKLEMITARQQFKTQYRYARLHFEIGGTPLALVAFKSTLEGEGSNGLFIPFADKTSGKHTYGGGRYLMVSEPPEGDEVFIDFNLVTNPLCSYADIYNCILPPQENRLRVPILAGVKKYH
jgi:uncharacterized protein (DUF1684 family)